MEIRVHGIGTHAPHEVLGAPLQLSGDSNGSAPVLLDGDKNIGTYALPASSQTNVHAFVWSRTTRRWLGSYRYLLLPFTLVNVAGYMRASGDESIDSRLFGWMVHCVGVTVSLTYFLWLGVWLNDLPSIYGVPENVQAAGAWTAVGVIFLPMLMNGLGAQSRERDPTLQTPEVGTDGFWAQTGSRAMFLGHLALTAVGWVALSAASAVWGDVILILFLAQVLLLTVGGALVYWRANRHGRPSEIGGLFALVAAVVTAHVGFAGTFQGVTAVLGLVYPMPLDRMDGLDRAVLHSGIQYWQLTATFLFATAVVWAHQFNARCSRFGDSPAERAATAAEYRVNSEEGWVREVTILRAKSYIQGIPASVLHDPLRLAAKIAVLAAVVWYSMFSQAVNLATAFLTHAVGPNWSVASLGVTLMVGACVLALAVWPSLRVKVAMAFDVLGYWPRQFHPLAPPPYAAVASARLRATIETHVNERDAVCVVGHSQGSVLAYTALQRATESVRARTSLVTCGSPLASLYASSFPRYFGVDAFRSLQTRLQTWVNVYRDTDPIGTPVFGGAPCSAGDVKILEVSAATKIQGHSGYWDDPQMRAILRRTCPIADSPR